MALCIFQQAEFVKKTPESNICIIDIYFLNLKAENFPRKKLGDFSERFGFVVYAVNRKPVLLISCFSTVTFKTCQGDTINLEKGTSEFSSLQCKIQTSSISKFIVFYWLRSNDKAQTSRKGWYYRLTVLRDLTRKSPIFSPEFSFELKFLQWLVVLGVFSQLDLVCFCQAEVSVLISSFLVSFHPTCLLLQVTESMSRTGDLCLNLFHRGNKFFVRSACRITTSVYSLPGHYFIPIWFALRTASNNNNTYIRT